MNKKKLSVLSSAAILAALINYHCAPTSKVEPVPEPTPEPAVKAEPGFSTKPYHNDMKSHMQISFDDADDIIIGVYNGKNDDEEKGTNYYFSDFKRFNKQTLTWGPVVNVVLPVFSQRFKPEIIRAQEFKRLSKLDLMGICWDSYEQKRYVYLIEGQPSLVFLEQKLNEATLNNDRFIIDAYPVTQDCHAEAVFAWMLRDYLNNN